MSELPIVAHGMRTFLGNTETFIGDQIITLRKFKPIVFCYNKQPFPGYTEIPESQSAINLTPKILRKIDLILYDKLRLPGGILLNNLSTYVQSYHPQILHYHFLVDARFFLSIKKRLHVPAIVSGYGYDVSEFTTRYWGLGLRYIKPIFKEIDCILAMSKDMRKDLIELGCPQEKIIVHYYGINTNKFQNKNKEYYDVENVKILCCASLRMKKGQQNLLKALHYAETHQMLKRKFTVTLVGEGRQRPILEQQINEYQWQDKAILTGHIPHNDKLLAQYYREADIFCLPSISSRKGGKEGIPGTIVEAMSAGIPVVSTYHAGIPEIITSGQDGLLVEENNIEQLARALSDLINDTETRRELGMKGFKRSTTELDVNMKTRELENIYGAVIEGSIRNWI